MKPERAGQKVAILLLLSAFLLVTVVSGAGGPPEHANADPRGIEAAGRGSNDDVVSNPGKNAGPKKEQVTPGAAPTDRPEPGETPTSAATPGAPQTAAPDMGAAAGKNPDPGRQGWLPWLALLLVAGGAALAWHLKRPPEPDPAATVLPGAYRTLPAHPAGFPPELAGRYDRVVFVGRGGLGQVFSAVRRDDRRTVAVKIPITYDEATGKTFMKEMRVWEDLVHPNIVEVYSVNILPVPFVEMEYLPRSLGDLEKPLPGETAARIAAGIAAGLAYAHGQGVIHRDIKPGNILLTDDLVPKIADWGMSTRPTETRETAAAGFTLAYAAPEQVAPSRFGRTDARTDIYQLGAVFYELVTGRSPYAGDDLAGFAGAVLHEEPVPPSAIREEVAWLDGVILTCLARDPAGRYQSAREVQAAIETLMKGAGHTTLT